MDKNRTTEIIGHTYGDGNTLLEVLEPGAKNRKGRFRCKCGNEFIARIGDIKHGSTRGCGCMRKHNLVHGLKSHPLYMTYITMKNRCYNPIANGYENYGGRGIKVSDEFLDSPKVFIDYISSLPNYDKREELKLTLDRIDNNGDYSRDNLRWATQREQYLNSRPRKDASRSAEV